MKYLNNNLNLMILYKNFLGYNNFKRLQWKNIPT